MSSHAADLSLDRLPTFTQIADRGLKRGLHPGLQVYVSREGQPVVDAALGEAASGAPLTPRSLMPWLSAGKPLTAAAILQQAERGALHRSDPVARHIPEFAAAGKQDITIEQLLTHTAGLLPAATGWPQATWDEMLERICQSRLRSNFTPGEQAAYDPARSWIVLGEILRRLDGRPVQQLVREEICGPLGMEDAWLALPAERASEYGSRLAVMHSGAPGALEPAAVQPAAIDAPPSPGGSFCGTARDLGRFYEMLLRGGVSEAGERILQPETIEAMTSRVRQGLFDQTFQHVIDFGLGVMINSNRHGVETVPYGFGRHASPGAFGHGGSQSSIGFADPEHDLVVVIIANGAPGEPAHQRRNRELTSAIYEDLGLAGAT